MGKKDKPSKKDETNPPPVEGKVKSKPEKNRWVQGAPKKEGKGRKFLESRPRRGTLTKKPITVRERKRAPSKQGPEKEDLRGGKKNPRKEKTRKCKKRKTKGGGKNQKRRGQIRKEGWLQQHKEKAMQERLLSEPTTQASRTRNPQKKKKDTEKERNSSRTT